MSLTIAPHYAAITAVHDICEPWVEIWSGDEWGESMSALLSATHTDYGLSDEDCATVAEMLLRNVIGQHEWMEAEGHSYGLSTPEQEAEARAKATEARGYWANGGNLGNWGGAPQDAKSVIDQMPEWMFES